MQHGRSRAWAFRVRGNSNIWHPPMSQTVIIRSVSDYRSLYTIIHSLVDGAYRWQLMMSWERPWRCALFRCVNFPPPPQKLGRQSLSIFCTGYVSNDPPNPENCVKIWQLVSEKWKLGVQMLRFYFWVLKGPQRHKKFHAPRTSFFEKRGLKVQLSHLSDLLHILHGVS